jgi:hypothetical protein
MRLNLSKCSAVPVGLLMEAPPQNSLSFEWLTVTSKMEKLLGLPINVYFAEDYVWRQILNKLTKSIQHWSAQNLPIYGRVHAARSYIGGQAWFLANIVPPNTKSFKRFTSMLWAFVQNNANLGDSNRHYSPWSRQTLVQQKSEGGLNAQDFDAHLPRFMLSGFLDCWTQGTLLPGSFCLFTFSTLLSSWRLTTQFF